MAGTHSSRLCCVDVQGGSAGASVVQEQRIQKEFVTCVCG